MSEWKPIPGFSDYVVSDAGAIMSLRRSPGHSLGKPLPPRIDRHGYIRHCLIGDDGKFHGVRAHVAVLSAFVGPRPDRHDGSHINGKKLDNSLANLCWETSSDNHQRKLAHGTLIHGEKHKCAKLRTEQVKDIRARAARGEKRIDLARQYGVSNTLVCRIVAGKAWMHAA